MKIVKEPNFKSITSLNLSYNRIPELPADLVLLENLQSLKVVCNLLTSCFPCLHLPSITDLDLSENSLSVISRRDILGPYSDDGTGSS